MRAMQARPIAFLTLARWLAGPLVWATHFLMVYGSESLLCGVRDGTVRHLTLVLVATAVALAALLAVTAVNWRCTAAPPDDPARGFMDWLAVALGLAGLLAVTWTALPAGLLPACLPPA
jgi:hypothetical protein